MLKTRVYARLIKALDTEASEARYAYLEAAERQQILNILRATDAEFSACYEALKKVADK